MSEIRPHEFLPDGEVSEWNGTPACAGCPLPKGNEVHDVPPVPAEVVEVEDRQFGGKA